MTTDNEMINVLLCLPPDKNKLLMEREPSSVKEYTAEHNTDYRTVYNVIRSVKIKNCIIMSSRTSPREMVEGHFMPSAKQGHMKELQ